LAKIEISGKPREDRQPNVIGGFLIIPLSEQPGDDWIRLFEKPTDRMDFQGSTLRVPLVEGVRRNVAGFLDQVVAAVEKTNAKSEAHQAESERAVENSRRQVKLAQDKFNSDLDSWWSEKGPGE
jgi:hypothetical protein